MAVYRVSRALQARNPQKVCEKFPGAFRPWGPPRVWKKSGKSLKSLEKVPKKFPKRLFETFSRLSGAPAPEAPGDFFQTFSGFRARRASETLVNGQRVPNFVMISAKHCWRVANTPGKPEQTLLLLTDDHVPVRHKTFPYPKKILLELFI